MTNTKKNCVRYIDDNTALVTKAFQKNASIFGTDLTKTVLADKIKVYFKAELAGPGAVRKTLHDAVNS